MKKILVSGGAGYIGSHTIVELAKAGYDFIVVDNFSNSNSAVISNLEKITGRKVECHNFDICDTVKLAQLWEATPFSGVIHFAAFKAVGESQFKPLQYYTNNVTSLLNVLSLCVSHNIPLVYSSSCTVYGQPDTLPVTENTPLLPAASVYGRTKQICEDIIRDTCIAYPNFPCVALRYFNPIGAHPSALIGELPNGVPSNLIPYITQAAAGLIPTLTIYGVDYNTPDGSCIRDFIHVVDLAKAHICALSALETGTIKGYNYYNVGTGSGTSVLELLNTFTRVTGVKVPLRVGQRRNGDIEKIWADTTKISTELNWSAKSTLEESLLTAWLWQQKLQKS